LPWHVLTPHLFLFLLKVTLPGSVLQIATQIHAEDKEVFTKFFKTQFGCYNLDAATAYSCWSLFDKWSRPYIVNVEPGLHTVAAVMTHPETHKAIEETHTDVRTFFTAGDSNEAAAVIIEVEVDAVMYEIPVASGGDANSQGFYFCGLRGVTDPSCKEMVANKIKDQWEGLGIDKATIIEL
jgi:hypothetical protein